MDRIPGLDMYYAPGPENGPPNIIDNFFPVYARSGNVRYEEDFIMKDIRTTKAPRTLIDAYDTKMKSPVTVIISDIPDKPEENITNLLHELKMVRKINHENILKFSEVICALTEPEHVALMFEPHRSLLSEMMAENFEFLYEPPVIKKIMKDLLTALSYLHENRIIHMDIQPENILFSPTGALKVWNFKYSIEFNQELDRTLRINDLRYQPMELLMESDKYTATTDVWSANCIFAHLWLKRPIFKEGGREEIMTSIFKLLGFPTKQIWEDFFSFYGVEQLVDLFANDLKKNYIKSYFKKYCHSPITPNALELIRQCFYFNPKHRPQAERCLMHPYFTEKPIECFKRSILKSIDNEELSHQIRDVRAMYGENLETVLKEIGKKEIEKGLRNLKIEKILKNMEMEEEITNTEIKQELNTEIEQELNTEIKQELNTEINQELNTEIKPELATIEIEQGLRSMKIEK